LSSSYVVITYYSLSLPCSSQ